MNTTREGSAADLGRLLADPTDSVRDAVARAADDPRLDLRALAVAMKSGDLPTNATPWNEVWFAYPKFRDAWAACATRSLHDVLTSEDAVETYPRDHALFPSLVVLSVLLMDVHIASAPTL